MTPPTIQALLILLLIALPLSSLIARRVPIVRILANLFLWAVILVMGAYVVGPREKFDPYLSHIAGMLKLDNQSVVGREVRIRLSPDGHFWADVTINGVERRMLVDSGATITALSVKTANAARLKVENNIFPVLLRTANGTVQAQTSSVERLQLGTVSATDVPVVVSPAFGDADILGMNFLSRLKSWRVERDTLILTPHTSKV